MRLAHALLTPAALTCFALSAQTAPDQAAPDQAAPKIKVTTQADLPRITYPYQGSTEHLITSSSADFLALMQPVRADIDRLLRDYDIQDRHTLRALLGAKLDLDVLSGQNTAQAHALIQQIRSLQDKPVYKLTGELIEEQYLNARAAQGPTAPNATCPAGFETLYRSAVTSLPWPVVREDIKEERRTDSLLTQTFLIGIVDVHLGPSLAKTHSISFNDALSLINARELAQITLACKQPALSVLTEYINHNEVARSDIWAARQAVLPSTENLHPVNVAIWDSGFDTALFPGQLWANTQPGNADPHGIAFDVFAHPAHGALIPLTPQQEADFPSMVKDLQAMSDLQNGIDSDAATAIKKKLTSMPPQNMRAYIDEMSAIDGYAHGTHVTGIAADGNPAIRLAYARMTYDNNNPHHPPSEEDTRANAVMFAQVVEWFKANNIRVVNMSWWDRPSNYEKDLEDNGIGRDAAERKELARRYFEIQKTALYNAIRNAPGILFVTIAGNSNADNAFEETIPSSFVLPNLIVAGAVDLAGDETSFTSYGKNVLVHANGYEVESVIPGGAKLRMSGTSMAAPQVTNLAAKLLAIDPSLTPTQLVELITKGADTSPDGRRHLMNPKQSLSLLQAHNTVAKQ